MPQQTTQPSQKQTYFSTLKEKLSKTGGGHFDKIKEAMGTLAHTQRDLMGSGLDFAAAESRLPITRDTASSLKRAKDAIFGAMKPSEDDPFRIPNTDVTFDPMLGSGGVAGSIKKPATVALKGAQSYLKEAKSIISKYQPSSDFLAMIRQYVKYSDFKELPEGETDPTKFVYGVRKAFEEYGYSDLTDTQLTRLSDALLKAMVDIPAKFQVSNPFGAKLKGNVPIKPTNNKSTK